MSQLPTQRPAPFPPSIRFPHGPSVILPSFKMVTLNLTALNKESGFIEVKSGLNRASVAIDLNVRFEGGIILSSGGSLTWTTAVVKLQWSLNKIGWHDFDSSVTFTTSTQARRGISISGARYLRFVTTTAEGASDPQAMASLWLT